MQKHHVLIDGNAIGYASQHSKPLTNGGEPVQAILGFLKTLMATKRKYPKSNVMILWDDKAQFRFDILPEYKGNRKVTDKQVADRAEYKKQLPHIMELARLLGVPQIKSVGFEADDLAGFFVRKTLKMGHAVQLITGDEDWAQLVCKDVSWFDPRRDGKVINNDNFKAMTGANNVLEFVIMKAMMGDNSDNIPGIEGLGEKAAVEIINKIGLTPLFQGRGVEIPDGFNNRFKKALLRLASADGVALLKRNIELMSLQFNKYDTDIKLNLYVVKQKVDMTAFFGACLDMNFSSITSRPEPWHTVFAPEGAVA